MKAAGLVEIQARPLSPGVPRHYEPSGSLILLNNPQRRGAVLDFGAHNPNAALSRQWMRSLLLHEWKATASVAPKVIPNDLSSLKDVDSWLGELEEHLASFGGECVFGIVIGRKVE